MFPSSNTGGSSDQHANGFEERMRNLILSNETTSSTTTSSSPAERKVPPHLAHLDPAEQRAYLDNVEAQQKVTPPKNQHNRKRPNQSQRRQMQSEFSVPVDTRPPPPHAGRGFAQPWNVQQQPMQHQQQNQNWRQAQYPPHQQVSPNFPHRNQQNYSSPQGKFANGPQMQHQQSPNFRRGQMHNRGHFQHNRPQNQQYHQQGGPAGFEPGYSRPLPQNQQLFNPGSQNAGRLNVNYNQVSGQRTQDQSSYLQRLVDERVASIAIDTTEVTEKEAFRDVIESICREAISQHESGSLANHNFVPSTVELKCFGSMKSGFATKASDMDLALLTPSSTPPADSPESTIPRLLEKRLLEEGFGARLLTRTRVPIIKLCQEPSSKLLASLLEERKKWDSGFVEGGGVAEEEEHEHTTKDEPTDPAAQKLEGNSSVEPFSTAQALKESASPETGDLRLKQKENQSLGDYFASAKRLLKKLDGRDVQSNTPELSHQEALLLNEVCKSFISGLSSEDLIFRLRGYKSVAFLFGEDLPFTQRSLNGVWNQIEGERFAMAYETRPIFEATEYRERECQQSVNAWRSLQDKYGPMAEPMSYNRQLYLAAEKLKGFNSLSLIFLRQIQHEEPVFYERRVQKILDDLKSRDQVDSTVITPIVISHYISGILNPDIRDIMQKSSGAFTNLSNAGLRHKILHLTADYEHGLQKDYFPEDAKDDVRRYIDHLSSLGSAEQAIDNEDIAALLAKIRLLPDPTSISSGKSRDRYHDPLEFPKNGIGIQCDINFSAQLALHNTLLLRCYSLSDPRVKNLVLFVKNWAKIRGINTPYRGSLSSYGYALMVLHYLVNVAQPFVCPNLQLIRREPGSNAATADTTCDGRDVRFWRDEVEIEDLASRGMLNHNQDSEGALLRGFFEYYAQSGQMSMVRGRGFDWGREVLSLRTQGGILTKQEKGWVGAKTVFEVKTVAAPTKSPNPDAPAKGEAEESKPRSQNTVEETKEVRHRYLFAIEDPFELDHNVARTVTHNGIVSIRDEFRRAWRIISNVGRGGEQHDLLEPVVAESTGLGLQALLDLIHGPASGGKES